MNRFLFALLPLLLVAACHPPDKKPVSGVGDAADSATTKNFFPVGDILKAEIADVDSTPYRIMLYHRQGAKKDSILVEHKDFDQLASVFLVPGLDSASFTRRFKESSFMDQTSGMLTFTYACKDTLFGLRRVDILAEPSLSTDKVRTVYLEVSAKENDSLKVKKMTWSFGKRFNIIEVVHIAGAPELLRETQVVWNN